MVTNIFVLGSVKMLIFTWPFTGLLWVIHESGQVCGVMKI